ncbi:MAG: class I SAM-dependent methyltransferase [Tissierellia bacterium]|nr:class I SAM-dependent methyltransferase [Tissierellia bacterium]
MIENVSQIFLAELNRKLNSIYFAADLTLGNGGDSLRILDYCKKIIKLYAFDIQESAILNSKKRIGKNNKIQYFQTGHENISTIIDTPLDFITMNLGYLPGGDKTITTRTKTTLMAIEQSLALLNHEGLMIITIYTGHDEGAKEKISILEKVKWIDQKIYTCRHQYFVNQKNQPPEVIIIEKR